VTEFSHVFENLFIVDLLLRWCFVVLLLHDFLFVVVLVPIRRMALKVTSDQAQQNLARKVAKLSRSIRSIAPERKISINTYGFTNVTDTIGTVAPLLSIVAGTDVSDRVGDKIRIKSIRLVLLSLLLLVSIGVTPTNNEFSRFLLVQDMQAVSDGTPVAQDVVQAVNRPDFLLRLWIRLVVLNGLWVSPLIHHAQIAYVSTSAAVLLLCCPQRRVLLFSIIIWQ